MSKIESSVRELLTEKLEELGFSIWDISFFKNHEGFNLQIELDRENGIDMDALSVANEKVNELLDEADIIKDAYILEVSSAGLERELKTDAQRELFVGRDVSVKLYAPLDGKKQLFGKLVAAADGNVTVLEGESELFVEKTKIASVKIDLFDANK